VAAARECRHLTSTQAPGKHALQCAALEPRVRSELGCDCNLTAGLPVTGADLHNRLKLLPMPLIRLHPVKDSGAAPAASCSVQLLEAVLGGGGGAAAALAFASEALSSVAVPTAAALCWVS
jgi:hypothetical protein